MPAPVAAARPIVESPITRPCGSSFSLSARAAERHEHVSQTLPERHHPPVRQTTRQSCFERATHCLVKERAATGTAAAVQNHVSRQANEFSRWREVGTRSDAVGSWIWLRHRYQPANRSRASKRSVPSSVSLTVKVQRSLLVSRRADR
jgi:hypothetical protein